MRKLGAGMVPCVSMGVGEQVGAGGRKSAGLSVLVGKLAEGMLRCAWLGVSVGLSVLQGTSSLCKGLAVG